MGMGRSFHHWGVREQLFGNGKVIPQLGSEGAVLMGMGRSFHHWGARVEKLRSRDEREPVTWLAGWARRPVAAERSGCPVGREGPSCWLQHKTRCCPWSDLSRGIMCEILDGILCGPGAFPVLPVYPKWSA